MKVKTQSFVRPLRSGSKVQQNMKFSGPPPEKMPKMAPQIEDLSILKKSVETSVTNPVEILKVFQGGTPEAIETMKNECSLIYECKVCRNLFRSIANFIIHKRSYCTTKFTMPEEPGFNGDVHNHSLIVGTMRGTVSSTRKTTRRDILSLLDNLQERIPESKQSHVFTEIPHTGAAVYNTTQTPQKPFKGESSNCTMVLGPTGQIIGRTRDGGLTTECKSCGETIRHMESHLSTCNSVFKQCFGCTLCEKYFTTSWAVYRHLRKVHGKNSEVSKLRSLIMKQEIPVESKCKKAPPVANTSAAASTSDKGWLEELEKNDADGLYKCYICGKQFERRVALLSHTQACEKRKPQGSPTELKKSQSSPREHLAEKQPAAIQMKICYKKDALVNKLTDCRVVATRLTDEDTLAALSPKSKDSESTNNDNMRHSVYSPNTLSVDNLSQVNQNMDDTLPPLIEEREANIKQEDNSFFQNSSMTDIDIVKVIHEPEEVINGDINGEVSDYRDEPSEDMFASQTSFEEVSRDYDVAEPSSQVETCIQNPSSHSITNGFLSPHAHTSKDVAAPPCRSPDKPCLGWNEPETNPARDNFFSSFVESTDSNDVDDNHCSIYNSLSNDEEDMKECDFDSIDVTRIICGSVKVLRRESDDVQEERDDIYSEKHTTSISTDMSFDFEVIDNKLESSDNESDELCITLDPYISKTDSVCLLCYDKITDTRCALNHVAEHLGVVRFACGVPSCTVRTFSRFDLVEHIRAEHMLESASLIKSLKYEEMFTDDTQDFHGFAASENAMTSAYSEFFGVLMNSHGISLVNQ